MEKMNSSKPHFIRCIKPNTDKIPDNFISNYVQKQLQYTGVMETARIRQCGFPTRLTFDDFCKRYTQCSHCHSELIVAQWTVATHRASTIGTVMAAMAIAVPVFED